MGIEGAPKSTYESMSFDALANDPVAGPILEQKALEFLQTDDAEYFNREYSGEMDEEGYLLKRDGTNSNTKPSQNIGGGIAMQKEMDMVKLEFQRPDTTAANNLEAQEKPSDVPEADEDYTKFPLLKDAPNEHILDWLFQGSRDLDPRNTWIKPDALARLKDQQAATLRELHRRIKQNAVADIDLGVLTELIRVYPELQ